MRNFPMTKIAPLMCAALWAGAAMAHDGHGWSGTHLHATDLFGFTVLAVAVAAAALWRGRK
jgi:hypothetical protein